MAENISNGGEVSARSRAPGRANAPEAHTRSCIMEESHELAYFRFVAGSVEDPKPVDQPQHSRIARCLPCNVIVIYSIALHAWVDDSGRYHTGHSLELPK